MPKSPISLSWVLLAGALLSLGSAVLHAAAFDHSHARFGNVLQTYVRKGAVNYSGLKGNRADLDTYLLDVASVTQSEFNGWGQQHKIAFLINAYNAAVLRLIIDHYPVSSIKRIGGLFSNPFRLKTLDLFGQRLSLDDLEHGILRPDFNEPRVHFALVCAARSCPNLRPEPYTPEKLNEQLQAQGKLFLTDISKNRVDWKQGIIHLSPIFKWFAEDFTTGDSPIIDFVRPYFSPSLQQELNRGKFRIKWMDYDWSLNDVPSKQ